VIRSCGNRRDVAGYDLLWDVNIIGCSVTKLARIVVAHRPKTPIAPQKKAVTISGGNLCYGLRSTGGWEQNQTQQKKNILEVFHFTAGSFFQISRFDQLDPFEL
jgi:hypothetical protein